MFFITGNTLKCDCLTRPLKHYINHLAPSIRTTDKKYQNITCSEPLNLANKNLLYLDEDRLNCAGNTEGMVGSGRIGDGNTEFDFVSEPDVAFRDVQ